MCTKGYLLWEWKVMKFMKKEKKKLKHFSPTLDPCKTAVQKCKGIVLALVMT